MDSQKQDIKNSYQLIIDSIKAFKGPDYYIIQTIQSVASRPSKAEIAFELQSQREVKLLMSMVAMKTI